MKDKAYFIHVYGLDNHWVKDRENYLAFLFCFGNA
jgi:hypothetical protein